MKQRIQRLRAAFEDRGLDGLVLVAPEQLSNVRIRHLSGFQGSSSYMVIGRDAAWLLTDFRYIEVAGERADGYSVVRHDPKVAETVARLVAGAGMKSVGFEDDRLPVRAMETWRSLMPEVTFTGAADLVEDARLVKDAAEIESLRRAAKLADEALLEVLPTLEGRTERDVAMTLEHRMRQLGLDGPGFDTIVASGVRGSLPHGQPTDKVIARGELVTIDFGGMSDGYRSDETVTVAIGAVSDRLRHIFDVVYAAQAAGIAAVRPGVLASAVDHAAREVVDAAGFAEAFGHGTGHGVGLEVHERPYASRHPGRDPDEVLRPGMTLTVEPGVYLPGVGGARVEDILVVTDGGSERLTGVPKEWREI